MIAERKCSYRLARAYSRPATTSEREVLCQFLKQQTARYEQENENAGQLALTDVCHMLLCSNEFVYID